MNRREIKNRIAFKIWTAVIRVEKYNTCAAVQILVAICFISFRDDSFTRGQSNLRRFMYERSVTNIHDWSLAYSFICMSMSVCLWDVLSVCRMVSRFVCHNFLKGKVSYISISNIEPLFHNMYYILWKFILIVCIKIKKVNEWARRRLHD